MKPEMPGLLSQPDVDGGLIGGASLNAKSFCSIVDRNQLGLNLVGIIRH